MLHDQLPPLQRPCTRRMLWIDPTWIAVSAQSPPEHPFCHYRFRLAAAFTHHHIQKIQFSQKIGMQFFFQGVITLFLSTAVLAAGELVFRRNPYSFEAKVYNEMTYIGQVHAEGGSGTVVYSITEGAEWG